MSVKCLVVSPGAKFSFCCEKSISFFLGWVLIMNVSWLKYSLLTHMASNTFSTSNNLAASSYDSDDLLNF